MRTWALLCVGLAAAGLHANQLPNVVIIYADDMGYGDLQANSPESKIPTPNLDQLAREGMRFTDGHSSSGVCTPSRFALLTGQHHWRRFHSIVRALGGTVFRPDDFTLAKMFKSKGYQTACVGKWHLGWDWDALRKADVRDPAREPANQPGDFDWKMPIPDGPRAQGFDYYYGDGTINFPPYCWIENDRVTEAPTVMGDTKAFKQIPEGNWEFRPGPAVEGWDPYDVLPTLTEKAVAWIDQQESGRPFFLYFALPSPHAPIIPNEEFRGTSEAGAYGDFVFETDAMTGRVLDELKRKDFARNTIVVFTSDNGPERYAYPRLREYGHWSSGPSRGLKRDVWEGGHRVPFVVRWPGHVPAGTVSDETVSQVDLAATLAHVIGYPLRADEAIDSYNLLPIWKDLPHEKPLRVATVQNTRARQYALRQGDWMFINAPTGEISKSPAWFNAARGYAKEPTPALLYNLRDDPAQRDNLYADRPEVVARMSDLLARYLDGEPCAPHASR